MNNKGHSDFGANSFKPIRRKNIRLSEETLVDLRPLAPGQPLPLLVQPGIRNLNLASWADNNRALIKSALCKYGALLFRGFGVDSPSQFEDFVRATSVGAIEYTERSSPRTQVMGNIYTSTDHPPDQTIFPHNEQSYNSVFPSKIYFFCARPAESGGETPIVDSRRVLERIGATYRERFVSRNYMYVRNFRGGFGLSWQDAFQTSDRRAVEDYCRRNGIESNWISEDHLQTRQVRRVVARHPQTGEATWFNHLTFFHISTLDQKLRDAILRAVGEESLPNNTYYGDGAAIEPAVMDALRNAYLQEKVVFAWQKGDVLMLDNMLTAHGRESYTGPREVLVAMADPLSWSDV